jgi:hypothetical protein
MLARVYEEEYARPDMAEYVRKGKKFQRLYELLRFEDRRWKSSMAMRRAFQSGPEEEGEDEPKTLWEWVEITMRRYEGDEGLRQIQQRARVRASRAALSELSINK